jgi:hypothetical protein
MMKNLFAIAIVALPLFTLSQTVDEDFQKLFDMHILNKHEDCLFKSLQYIEKDKYRREPEPYLFAARSSMWLSENADDWDASEDYAKDAIKYGIKYVKYKNKIDEEETRELYNNLYDQDVTDLSELALEQAKYYHVEGKESKTAYFVKKLYKLNPNDPTRQMLAGLAMMSRRNMRQGQMEFDEGYEKALEVHGAPGFISNELERDVTFYLLETLADVTVHMNKTDVYSEILEDLSQTLPEDKIEKLQNEIAEARTEG